MGIGLRRLVLPGAGLAVLTAAAVGAAVVRAPVGGFPGQPTNPGETVVVYGRGGGFGVAGDVLASGQSLGRRIVPQWGMPAGTASAAAVTTDDGTVLWGSRSLELGVDAPTAAVTAFGSYRPATNRYTEVRLRTSTGRDEVRDAGGRPAAPSISGLAALPGRRSYVFTVSSGIFKQDLAANGAWPVLGVLTNVDGRWQVTRQWTGRQLRDANGAVGAQTCPQRTADVAESDCRQFADVAVMPRSGDVLLVQNYGTGPDTNPPPPWPPTGSSAWLGGTPSGNGGIAVARLGDAGVRILNQVTYPQVRIPGMLDGRLLRVIPERVATDPTSEPGDERFVVTFAVADGEKVPRFLQEFSYDNATGAVTPVSAPFIPGDHGPAPGKGSPPPFQGLFATLYDRNGNLWASRADAVIGIAGGRMAVYTRDFRRRCGPTGTNNFTAEGGAFAWGRVCVPDFDLLTGESNQTSHGLVEDPKTGMIASLHWGGHVQTYLPAGSGRRMTFEIGNALDLGRKLLAKNDNDYAIGTVGGFDAAGRLWTTASVLRQGGLDARTDQFLYSIDVRDLHDPTPTDLPTGPGRPITVQAERTVTTGTGSRLGRNGHTVEVWAVATTGSCNNLFTLTACGYDGTSGDGYVLRDHSNFGILDGTRIEYLVRVPTPGTYRMSYRVGTLPTSDAIIGAAIAGYTSETYIKTEGAWLTIAASKLLELPAGTFTLTLSAPRGGGGWYLNHLVFERL